MKPVALVTGGQQGIGLGVAKALVQAGWVVALASEVPSDAESVRNALAALGKGAHYFRHDLADVSGCAALLDAVETRLGPVACLVQNAGVPAKVRGDMLDLTPDNFDFVLDINLRGAFFLAQEVVRRMLVQEVAAYRSIIFVTSVSATMASIERAEYCISKAGAGMMARLFTLRLAPHGIGVFDLRPGIIETGMTAAVKERFTARIAEGLVPAGRWGQPADIGSIVVPLAEGRMAFATGAIIPVDGGLSIARL